jgi:hypothetical protein
LSDNPSVTDDLEIDGDLMASEIQAHVASAPPVVPIVAAADLIHPPLELADEEPAATPVVAAPVAAAPDASALLMQELTASRALNEKMLAALERMATPAPVAAPTPEDPFAGLDPSDPDDKLEIANRRVAILQQQFESFAQSVNQERQASQANHATTLNSSRLAAEVENVAARLGVTDREQKAVLFDLASTAWGQAGWNPQHFDVAKMALRNAEGLYKHARQAAVRPLTQQNREPVAPVRGAAQGTLPPVKTASEKRWETANIYDIDQMAEMFAADLNGPH